MSTVLNLPCKPLGQQGEHLVVGDAFEAAKHRAAPPRRLRGFEFKPSPASFITREAAKHRAAPLRRLREFELKPSPASFITREAARHKA